MLRINRVDSCVLGVNLSWRGEPDSCGGLNLEHLGPEAHSWWCQPSNASERAYNRVKKSHAATCWEGVPAAPVALRQGHGAGAGRLGYLSLAGRMSEELMSVASLLSSRAASISS